MAAVSKMKLMDASEEDDVSEQEGPVKSSGRQPTRTSKRSAVIQSSSDSEHDRKGMKNCSGGHKGGLNSSTFYIHHWPFISETPSTKEHFIGVEMLTVYQTSVQQTGSVNWLNACKDVLIVL